MLFKTLNEKKIQIHLKIQSEDNFFSFEKISNQKQEFLNFLQNEEFKNRRIYL